MRKNASILSAGLVLLIAGSSLGACTTVTLQGNEDKPIVVNLNVNISQEVRIKMDKEVTDLINNNPNIF
ncbi:MAG TPA: YnbE family lipoprotein [Parvularculaceae bacterium]|nr:YnbE family lipoprotein [Parvularculaceae bacterium]